MFTSRAEYRLKLRADNADQRLTPLGETLGCVGPERRRVFAAKATAMDAGRTLLECLTLTPNEAARHGIDVNKDGRRRTAFELLALPTVDFDRLKAVWPEIARLDAATSAQIEVDARYAAYVRRQDIDVAALRRDENVRIPADFDFAGISSLSTEVRQKLVRHRPDTLAQAARIDGMTPAALTLLLAGVKRSVTRKSA